MKREIDALERGNFDVVVIGCGIHGACVARDAALRGLRVAAFDMGDVSGATSHNSLKTIHGGVRYIQHLDFKRARESINEQRYWLRTAPHLVRPMPFLMPTYGHGLRGPLAMLAGMSLYELLGLDRNRHLTGGARLKRSRVLSRGACLQLAPDVDAHGLTGAALWTDAQVAHADRAALQVLQHAVDHGAIVANHLRADMLLREGQRIVGVRATDALTGRVIEMTGRMVVNAAGPWVARFSGPDAQSDRALRVPLTRSMNIVTRLPAREQAIAFKSERPSDSVVGATRRLFFMVPWSGRTVFGTAHVPHDPARPEAGIATRDVENFVQELDRARPGLALTPEDVLYAYQGMTPASDDDGGHGTRLHESKVIEHTPAQGLGGLVSIVSIKWTTARLVAERVVDVLAARLDASARCRTRDAPIPDTPNLSWHAAGLDTLSLQRFCDAHMDHSMSVRLCDMLLRRTDDLVAGRLSVEEVATVARCMRERLGWSEQRCAEELDTLRDRWLPAAIRQRLTPEEIWS